MAMISVELSELSWPAPGQGWLETANDCRCEIEVDDDGDWSVHSIQFCCDMGKGIAEWGPILVDVPTCKTAHSAIIRGKWSEHIEEQISLADPPTVKRETPYRPILISGAVG